MPGPSTPYARVLTALNGGAPTGGGISANGGDVVQFSAESTVGWPAGVSPKWELYAYPPSGFPVPAGWTDSGAGSYYYLGVTPPSFTLPATSVAWGKYLPRLTIGGGRLNGETASQMVDETAGLDVVSPGLGLHDVAWQEGSQFSSQRWWTAAVQSTLRTLDLAADAPVLSGAAIVTTNTITEAGDTGNKWSAWKLSSLSTANTNAGVLYWVGDLNAGAARIQLYSDSLKTHRVGVGQLGDDLGGTITIGQDNSSGITGTVVAAAGVGTDNDAGNTLTCDLPPTLATIQVPDGYAGILDVVAIGHCVSGDKSGELYMVRATVEVGHLGALVAFTVPSVPTSGILFSSSNIADVKGVNGSIAAGGLITLLIDGRSDNTINWRGTARFNPLALAS